MVKKSVVLNRQVKNNSVYMKIRLSKKFSNMRKVLIVNILNV